MKLSTLNILREYIRENNLFRLAIPYKENVSEPYYVDNSSELKKQPKNPFIGKTSSGKSQGRFNESGIINHPMGKFFYKTIEINNPLLRGTEEPYLYPHAEKTANYILRQIGLKVPPMRTLELTPTTHTLIQPYIEGHPLQFLTRYEPIENVLNKVPREDLLKTAIADTMFIDPDRHDLQYLLDKNHNIFPADYERSFSPNINYIRQHYNNFKHDNILFQKYLSHFPEMEIPHKVFSDILTPKEKILNHYNNFYLPHVKLLGYDPHNLNKHFSYFFTLLHNLNNQPRPKVKDFINGIHYLRGKI